MAPPIIYQLLILSLLSSRSTSDFAPDTKSYDAYGLKLAANDVMMVEVRSDSKTFLVQFAPYNYTTTSLQCSINYDDSTHYVYSVGIGSQQKTNTTPYFFVVGEVLPPTDQSGHNGTFIGLWRNNDTTLAQQYADAEQTISCDYFQIEQLKFLSDYAHQEFMVLTVDPYGQFALVLATDFVFIYRPFTNNSNDVIIVTKSTLVWPNNVTFMPRAADTDINFTIVAGFVDQGPNSQIRSKPVVYLMSNDLIVLDSWSYTPTNSTWQSRLTNAGSTGIWSAMYVMSVDINPFDHTRVLVGLPSTNTLLFFTVSNDYTKITLTSFIDNGGNLGFGKGVAWLALNQAAVLNSAYSLDYNTWFSSQVYLYTNANDTSLGAAVTAVIPNTQQPLGTTISPLIINIISTPSSLAILDGSGGILFLLATAPGYYASTDTSKLRGTATMPVISQQVTCIGGTYKNDTGVHSCFPCVNGSKNSRDTPGIVCTACASSAFCPLGAVAEIDASELQTLSQAQAYPKSPESTIFDEILIQNMFSIGGSFHCILVSPLFWTFTVMFCPIHPKKHIWREQIKNVFRQMDLVGEGELWIGGLMSIAVVVLVSFAAVFSSGYLRQYPAEKSSPSSFACDTTIRNAKFDTNLLSLSIPPSDEEQTMFDLLSSQQFFLHIDLLNTLIKCASLSINQVLGDGTSTSPLSFTSCTDGVNGTLSTIILLSYQAMTVQLVIQDIQLIGAIRIGLSGNEIQIERRTLKELHFRQTFSVTDRTLAQTVNFNLQLTKVVNETESMDGLDESEFEGIWYPTFLVDKNQIFLSQEQYMTTAHLSKTTVIIVISETAFYIKNHQSPIAKQPEIIFHNLLFTIVCLEIFGLVILLFKLILIPLIELFKDLKHSQQNRHIQPRNTETDNQQMEEQQHWTQKLEEKH
ncbi:unnamed protein product [Adineta steineri]|uniref:Transmembrane protein n=1 Tax=Adineta steineri TaxID=433720 RepID=A0A818Y5H1_9BILA|nr:unnamed protein product [Adineta steineri]